jgi:hyperosmotically inducible periplasmic protein
LVIEGPTAFIKEDRDMFARYVAAAMVMFAVSTPALAADRENLEVFRDVQQQVLRYSHFTIFDSVHAEVENGVVTLTGKVTMPYKRDEIGRRVEKVDGVQQVRNRVEVLPVSQFDDDLRFQIARAIYGNSNFWTYGSMINPPIHIVVEHGRVTLEGVVNNEVDRMLARSIAGSFGAFALTNNLKTTAEARAELERL